MQLRVKVQQVLQFTSAVVALNDIKCLTITHLQINMTEVKQQITLMDVSGVLSP